MGRPKGQHSAPRGGPPRSWTNAELTEALQHVWNKKMTTSQASRIFGIPYNSLLMYVRGKYGKSLKLEQLKKDCLGGPGGPLDLLSIGANPGNNNNHPGKPQAEDITSHGTRTTDQDMSLPPGFNPYAAANFFPDFGPPFPVPVSMIHLLPQSEKNRELFGQTDKARDLFHPTDKAREIFHQTEKARELFNQAMQLPQDLSSPDSKEDEFRAVRSKSRDNNNVTSLEGSPVTNLKSEPHPPMMENGSENWSILMRPKWMKSRDRSIRLSQNKTVGETFKWRISKFYQCCWTFSRIVGDFFLYQLNKSSTGLGTMRVNTVIQGAAFRTTFHVTRAPLQLPVLDFWSNKIIQVSKIAFCSTMKITMKSQKKLPFAQNTTLFEEEYLL